MNGLEYDILDEESHRGAEMVKVDGPRIDNGPTWVFKEELPQ
jgi:hypothetical protein